MALDKNCSDRSYLFGRLLAIADAIENSTYTDEDRRETNAIRMQKVFTLRPMATWSALWDKLVPTTSVWHSPNQNFTDITRV